MNEIKIERECLVFLALLYNYLANNIKEIYHSYFYFYLTAVNEKLREMGSSYQISHDINKNNNEFFDIDYNLSQDRYRLTSTEKLLMLYRNLPDEVINASLDAEALSNIHVDKVALDITINYKRENQKMDIYSLSSQTAMESVRNILTEAGCRNIKFSYAIPDQLDGDKGYHIGYICDKPYESVNLLSKTKK